MRLLVIAILLTGCATLEDKCQRNHRKYGYHDAETCVREERSKPSYFSKFAKGWAETPRRESMTCSKQLNGDYLCD